MNSSMPAARLLEYLREFSDGGGVHLSVASRSSTSALVSGWSSMSSRIRAWEVAQLAQNNGASSRSTRTPGLACARDGLGVPPSRPSPGDLAKVDRCGPAGTERQTEQRQAHGQQ